MSIVGNIECNGLAQVFGRIEGELRASDLLISSGAQVEGSIIAQDVTVCGRVKGTISAVRVKLKDCVPTPLCRGTNSRAASGVAKRAAAWVNDLTWSFWSMSVVTGQLRCWCSVKA